MTWYSFIINLLPAALGVIVGVVGTIITHNDSIIELSRERLDKVYHPLFLAIEPFLYKENLTLEKVKPFVDTYNEIERNYSLLINPSLRQHMQRISTPHFTFKTTGKFRNNDWYHICNYVSSDYDKLCRKAHMPLRSITYRVNYRQYKEKYQLYIYLFFMYLPSIVVMTVFFAFVYSLFR